MSLLLKNRSTLGFQKFSGNIHSSFSSNTLLNSQDRILQLRQQNIAKPTINSPLVDPLLFSGTAEVLTPVVYRDYVNMIVSVLGYCNGLPL